MVRFGLFVWSGDVWWCLVAVGCVHTKSQGRLREDRVYSFRLDNSRDLLLILCQDNLERCQFSASLPGWLCIASIETRYLVRSLSAVHGSAGSRLHVRFSLSDMWKSHFLNHQLFGPAKMRPRPTPFSTDQRLSRVAFANSARECPCPLHAR